MRKKILIVDDVESVRTSLEMLLGDDGLETVSAHSGANAQQLIEGHAFRGEPFHLVLSDVDMEGISGQELISWIKNKFPTLPCILMSVGDEPVGHVADKFIPKLGSISQMKDIINGFLAGVNQDDVPTTPSFPVHTEN